MERLQKLLEEREEMLAEKREWGRLNRDDDDEVEGSQNQ